MEKYLVMADPAKLSDEEYLRLADHFLGYIYASSTELNVTGFCYFKLMYENDSERFEKLLVKSGYLMKRDEYPDMTLEMLLFCNERSYKEYLMSAPDSDEVRDARDNLEYDINHYREEKWYKNMCAKYSELIRKLEE
ncbi:MAG: hypothetical protein E7494_14790 [Ruminococcus albus]|jgi:hypothetical protein|nr:hypothetical protein [Ruminococcus albus]